MLLKFMGFHKLKITKRFLMGRCSSISLSGSRSRCEKVNLKVKSPNPHLADLTQETILDEDCTLNGKNAFFITFFLHWCALGASFFVTACMLALATNQ